jgi:uncharacterized protein YfaQ (DUF2300 family)
VGVAQSCAKLAQVKLALAEKYEHLAAVVKSKPRRKVWLRMADKHRRQAADLQRAAAGG